ncbi:MAG: protein kinase [Eubacteriales bacterium]|nr:protein kinase [Eubacteriales bacterium]
MLNSTLYEKLVFVATTLIKFNFTDKVYIENLLSACLYIANDRLTFVFKPDELNDSIQEEFHEMIGLLEKHAIDPPQFKLELKAQMEAAFKNNPNAASALKTAEKHYENMLSALPDHRTAVTFVDYVLKNPTPVIQATLDRCSVATVAHKPGGSATAFIPIPQSADQNATAFEMKSTSVDGQTVAQRHAPAFQASAPTELIQDSDAKSSPANSSQVSDFDDALLSALFKPLGDPIKGGFGAVQKFYHVQHDTVIAVKRPYAGYYTEALFFDECMRWINIGFHPNIVTCYYVRPVNGQLSIFFEWMDGGSLENIIQNKSLYAGTQQEVLKRILDISIQFARGLKFIHQNNQMHRDVKPDNLLLDRAGNAKVTDLGLAQALNAKRLSAQHSSQTSVTKSGVACTIKYASPEQLDGQEPTEKTDIWSFAVSLVEMFTGHTMWMAGSIFETELGCYIFGDTKYNIPKPRVGVPAEIVTLLKHCFMREPSERPTGFAEIESRLLKVYQREIGSAYPEKPQKMQNDTADILNNQALSYLYTGDTARARELLRQAIKASPNHAEANYNYLLLLWRTEANFPYSRLDIRLGDVHDYTAVEKLRIQAESTKNDAFLENLVQIHLERGNDCEALELLKQLIVKHPQKAEYYQTLIQFAEKRNSGWLIPSDNRIHIYNADDHKKEDLIYNGQKIGYYYVSRDKKTRLQFNTLSYNPNVMYAPGGPKPVLRVNSIVIVDHESNSVKKSLYCQANNMQFSNVWFTADEKCIIALSESKTQNAGGVLIGVSLFDIKTYRCLSSILFPANKKLEEPKIMFSPDGTNFKFSGISSAFAYPKFDYAAEYSFAPLKAYVSSEAANDRYQSKEKAIRDLLEKKEIAGALSELNDISDMPEFVETEAFYELNHEVGKYCIRKDIQSYKLFRNEKQEYKNPFTKSKVLVSSDGTLIMSWLDPQLYDAKANKTVIQSICFDSEILSTAAFSNNGNRFIAGIETKRIDLAAKKTTTNYIIKLWDARTGRLLKTLTSETPVLGLKFSQDSLRVIVVTRDFVVCLRAEDGAKYFHIANSGDKDFLINADCTKIAMRSLTDCSVYELFAGKWIGTLKVPSYLPMTSLYLGEEHLLCRNHMMGQEVNGTNVDVYNIFTKQKIQTFMAPPNTYIRRAWISEGRKHVFMITTDKLLRAYHLNTKKAVGALDVSTDYNDIIFINPKLTTQNIEQVQVAWSYEFPGWKDWDAQIDGIVKNFIKNYPNYTDGQFESFISILQLCDLGWIRPEGIRRKMEEMKNTQP